MYSLTVSAAKDYVRRALDELTSVENIGMLVAPDAIDLHKLVEGFLVEAAVRVHSTAPSIVLDGIEGVKDTDYEVEITDGVITIKMQKDTLRVISVNVSDSEYVVTDFLAESSPEGRAQLNQYVRGVPDAPKVVVQKMQTGNYRPVLKYYSTNATIAYKDKSEVPENEEGEDVIDFVIVNVEYVPYPVIEETVILVCPKLEYAVLNELTAMVMDSLSLTEKANLFREKSKSYII